MKIKMIRNHTGSNSGRFVREFIEGTIYDVVEDRKQLKYGHNQISIELSEAFVDAIGCAEYYEKVEIQQEKVLPVHEEKIVKAVENKMIEPEEVKSTPAKRRRPPKRKPAKRK